MQNSEIKGQRHLNDEVRRTARSARDRDRFLEHLRKVQEQASAGGPNVDQPDLSDDEHPSQRGPRP